MEPGPAIDAAQANFRRILPQIRAITDDAVLAQRRLNQATLFQAKAFTPDTKAYAGYAKLNGLDKKGLTDQAINWLDTWTNIDMEENQKNVGAPPRDVVETLSKFKPDKPVTLYRGIPAGKGAVEYRLGNITGYESWTRNRPTAEKWAGKDGNVERRVVQPEDILVDFGKLPKDYFDINGNVEREVIVKAQQPLYQASNIGKANFITPDGKIIDITMSPIGVSNRINTSQLLEAAAGKVAATIR
jgi:hypothetical protein